MRLYFTEYANSAQFGVRPLQFAAVLGAIAIGLVLNRLSGTPASHVAIWCVTIALGEAGVAVVNSSFLRRAPPDSDLQAWALTKAGIASLGGFTWALSAPLLYVEGDALTSVVPPWTILMYCCGAVWAGAFYAPALFGMILCSTVPAGLWMLTREGLEREAGLCTLIAVPYLTVIGRAAAARYRSAVNDKLQVEALMRQQRVYTERIEQLSAERTRFFSAASHDLRQPLHAMGLYISLLRDSAHGERDALIENIAQCGASLDQQFNAIMGVNETDKLIELAETRAAPLQPILERVAVQARPRLMARDVRLRVARTSAWAAVAPEILERVLVNLVSNALRYTERGGVLIGARRRGDDVLVCVIDTGVGIAPEYQERVFGDFFQIGNAERNRDRGFGLGLAIVRRLCDGMTWPIRMRSEPGRGTSFVVALPAAAPVEAAAPEAASTAPAPAASRRVLIVDDDAQVRDAMQRTLARWGVAADVCDNAQEALAILAAGEQDRWRVLVDYRLGGDRSGLDLAQEITAAHGDRALPAIITGDADETVESRAAAQGVLVLRKPVPPMKLRALLAS